MAFSLQLTESSTAVADACRTVEQVLATISELYELTLSVELMQDFDSVPEGEKNRVIKRTYASYRHSIKTIAINKSTFLPLSPKIQQAVIAHEVGHAWAHLPSSSRVLLAYKTLGANGEEFLADRLACKWGFTEGLYAERNTSLGLEYVDALQCWENETDYCEAMTKWHNQYLAGIIRRKLA